MLRECPAFNRTVVLRYQIHLEQKGYAPNTINPHLAAVRRVASHYRDFIAFASRDNHPSAGQIRPRGLIVPVYSHRERNGRSECQGTGGHVCDGGPNHNGHGLRIAGRGGEAGVGGEPQENLREGEREQQRGGAAERGVLHVVHQHLKASPHRESSGDYGAGDMGDCRHRAVANGCAQDSLRSRTAARY